MTSRLSQNVCKVQQLNVHRASEYDCLVLVTGMDEFQLVDLMSTLN